MALSGPARHALALAIGNPSAGQELADNVDNSAKTNTNNVFTGDCDFKRVKAHQGTTHVAGDFALSAGFGSTASVSNVQANSNDCRFRITITSAGTGQAANPTLTLTFHDGTWTTLPVAVCCRGGGSQPTVQFSVTTISATQIVLTFNGTPVAAETYTLDCIVMG